MEFLAIIKAKSLWLFFLIFGILNQLSGCVPWMLLALSLKMYIRSALEDDIQSWMLFNVQTDQQNELPFPEGGSYYSPNVAFIIFRDNWRTVYQNWPFWVITLITSTALKETGPIWWPDRLNWVLISFSAKFIANFKCNK